MKDTSVDDAKGATTAMREAGSIEADGDANTMAERLAQRLEDAVERSMNDLKSERTPLPPV